MSTSAVEETIRLTELERCARCVGRTRDEQFDLQLRGKVHPLQFFLHRDPSESRLLMTRKYELDSVVYEV
jgi:hypothetical protein